MESADETSEVVDAVDCVDKGVIYGVMEGDGSGLTMIRRHSLMMLL